ncbi:MAG: DNA mismatch repair protein MutS, partial [Bacteroidota bacterium]|nr:DNA mismatch repair protein MutS [Bacteroidota bacterium]
MLVDKTTLADLSIFHSEEEQSVFHHLNATQTNGGREQLRQLLGHPLDSIKDILDTQKTIQQLMEVAGEWPVIVTNGNIMMIEKYYESQINKLPVHPNRVDSYLYKLLNKYDFSLIRYSVGHALDFTKGLQQIVDLLQDKPLSRQLTT